MPHFFLSLLQLVCVLDVFPHRAGIGVALPAAGVLADVRFSRDMRLHVLRTVTRVVELFRATFVVTLVGLFTGVGTYVQFEVLEPRKRASASRILAPVRLFSSVAAKVCDQLVPGIKWLLTSSAVFPETDVLVHRECVTSVQVDHEGFQRWKLLVATLPAADKRSTLLHVLFGEVRSCGGDSGEARLEQKGRAPWVEEKSLLEQRLLLLLGS